MKIYKCSKCGQIISIIKETGVPIICCGEPMKKMEVGLSDGAAEKHVPVYETSGCTIHVKIGESPHPMTEDHYIEWIAIDTNKGNYRKWFRPNDKPEASFTLNKDETPKAVYDYCNLHGLWRKDSPAE